MPRAVALAALLLALAAAPPAEAQRVDAVGFRAGPNVSRITSSFAGYGDRRGLQAAAFAEVPLLPGVWLVGEAQYAQRGYTIRDDRFDASTTTLHYLSIPVLTRVAAPGPGGVLLYGLAGPSFEFLLGREPGRLVTPEGDTEDELAPLFGPFNASIGLGGGVALPGVAGGALRLEARMLFGIVDQVDVPTAGGVYLQGTEVSVGFSF